jgi:DNA-binding NarL/FixJ family response regulator
MGLKKYPVTPISILLVDENPTFLQILARFFNDKYHEEFTVIGTVANFDEALAQAQVARPNTIVHDLGLPGFTGIPSISRLREKLPTIGIIALTLLDSPTHREVALRAGADDLIYKGRLVSELPPAIRRLAKVRSSTDGSPG